MAIELKVTELGAWGFDPEVDIANPDVTFGRGQFAWLTPFSQYVISLFPAFGYEDAADRLSLPGAKGVDFRGMGQTMYLAGILVKPEEIPEREKKFREVIVPWIEDFEREWGKLKEQCFEATKPFRGMDFTKLSDVDLRCFLEFDCYKMMRTIWFIHFFAMYPSNTVYVLLEQIVKEQTGIDDRNALFTDMMIGFDNRFFETSRKLWSLAQQARELGLEKTFLETKIEGIIPKCQETKEGQKWLEGLEDFLKTDGWRAETMHEIASVPWVDDPAPALRAIADFLGQKGLVLEEMRAGLVKRREAAIKEIRSRLTTEEARNNFDTLLPLAQKAAVYNEEHPFYTEYYSQTGYYRVLKEAGRRFVEAGAMDDWMDIFMLLPEEINRSLVPRAQQDLRPVIKRRRAWWHERIEAEKRGELPPVVGAMKPPADPTLQKIVGAGVMVEPIAEADVTGLPGSSGVVEGVARLIMTVEEIDQIKPGEILVTPYTSAAFTPVFSIIKGVVTDTGGTLAHAAVVAREHGIPAVVLTREGSRKITTGQKIRVDGTKGTVYILQK